MCRAALQVFGTGWFISRLGIGLGLSLVPITSVLGMLCLLSSPTLFAVSLVRLLRNALNFAIARPSKELLFTGMCRTVLNGVGFRPFEASSDVKLSYNRRKQQSTGRRSSSPRI